MKIIGLGCLIAQMKCQDTLIALQKTLTLSDVPLLQNQDKNPKLVMFGKMVIFGGFS